MRAALLQGPYAFDVVDRALPGLASGEARIAIEQCGVCTSDIGFWTGKAAPLSLPAPLGHEVAGIVQEVGPDVRLQVGDRVAAWIDGGGFAEEAIVEERLS